MFSLRHKAHRAAPHRAGHDLEAATGSADNIRTLLRETPRELSETPRPPDDCFIRRTETASRTLGRHATGRCNSGAIVVGHHHGTPPHASAISVQQIRR